MMCCFKKGKYQRKLYRKRRVDSETCKATFPLYSEMASSQSGYRVHREHLSNGDDPEKTNGSSRKREIGENTEGSKNVWFIEAKKKKKRGIPFLRKIY